MTGFPCVRDDAATSWSERDELVARTTDLLIAEAEAESRLQIAAHYVDADGTERLIVAARAYRDARHALAEWQSQVPVEALYGEGLVVGEALGVAKDVRSLRLASQIGVPS